MPPVPPHKPDDPLKPVELEPLAQRTSPTKDKVKKKGFALLFVSLSVGTFISVILALILVYLKLSTNVILPVIAPVWIGSTTLIFMAWKESDK